jgi:N-terminal half of MaoC dehydratase
VTSTARTSISAFPRGHEFPPATFSLTPEGVHVYLAAIGDENGYGDTAPPLALAALGLNALQEQISLPEGSLHTGQEVEHSATARAGESLTLTGRIAQRSERQGFVISVIEFEIAGAAGIVIRARTTIMAPGGAS